MDKINKTENLQKYNFNDKIEENNRWKELSPIPRINGMIYDIPRFKCPDCNIIFSADFLNLDNYKEFYRYCPFCGHQMINKKEE